VQVSSQVQAPAALPPLPIVYEDRWTKHQILEGNGEVTITVPAGIQTSECPERQADIPTTSGLVNL
jgi:hypothetical protein